MMNTDILTFVEAKEKYFNYSSNYKNKAKGTLKVYNNLLEEFHRFLKWYKQVFEVKISDIQIEDIHEYITHKKSQISPLTKTHISPNTLYMHSAAIRSFFKYLNTIWASDLFFTRIEYVPTEPPKVHYLTDEELQILLHAPSIEPRPLIRYRNRAIMYLGYYCGLRAHEILAVKFSDIPRKWGAIYIKGKRGKFRQIWIRKEISDIIYEYHELKKKILWAFRGSASDFICTTFSNNSKKDKVLNPSAITQMFDRYKRILGLPKKISSHCLRRKFWTDLYEFWTSMEVVQKLMGHQDIQTTLRYVKISDNILKKNCLKLK